MPMKRSKPIKPLADSRETKVVGPSETKPACADETKEAR